MSRLCLSLTVAALAASMTCGCGAFAIHRAYAEPGVENPGLIRTFHRSQGGKLDQEAVERGETEMSQDEAKWNACNEDTKDRRLSGRKSWSYLYDCMTKA